MTECICPSCLDTTHYTQLTKTSRRTHVPPCQPYVGEAVRATLLLDRTDLRDAVANYPSTVTLGVSSCRHKTPHKIHDAAASFKLMMAPSSRSRMLYEFHRTDWELGIPTLNLLFDV